MPQSKTQTDKLNKKSKPIGTLYPDPSHKQGHKDSKQRVGGRLTNQMESKKTKTKTKNQNQTNKTKQEL